MSDACILGKRKSEYLGSTPDMITQISFSTYILWEFPKKEKTGNNQHRTLLHFVMKDKKSIYAV